MGHRCVKSQSESVVSPRANAGRRGGEVAKRPVTCLHGREGLSTPWRFGETQGDGSHAKDAAAVVRRDVLAYSSRAAPVEWRPVSMDNGEQARLGCGRLTTIGRRSGKERTVILGYVEDGPNLVTLAMNGWGEGRPSWWLNLKTHPDAVIRLAGQAARPVHAREVVGQERDRLWKRWAAVDRNLNGYASRRSTRTPVVILEPRGSTPDLGRSSSGS